MGRSRYKQHEPWYPYFISSSFVHGLPLFSKPEIVQIVIDLLKFHQHQKGLKIFSYCIMENHVNLIVEHDDLKTCMQSIKSYSAKQILEFLKAANNQLYLKQLKFSKQQGKKESKYQVWQEGYHPKQISTQKMLEQKVQYIHYNPVKRGYVDLAEDWRYSSARNFLGKEGLLEIDRIC
ncbi:MAG: transposase [Gracilimonas sp.]